MNVVLANRNIEIERTKVHASTVHALFQFDSEYKSKIDFGKHTQAEMELLLMEVFLLDEVSMLDDPCFASICDVMSTIDDSRQPKNKGADCFGKTHLIMFGDFKQETCLCVLSLSRFMPYKCGIDTHTSSNSKYSHALAKDYLVVLWM